MKKQNGKNNGLALRSEGLTEKPPGNVNAVEKTTLPISPLLPAPMALVPARPAPLPEGFITKDEVARRLKKSERTVENWQRRGIVPFTKVGHAVLYIWADVEMQVQARFNSANKS